MRPAALALALLAGCGESPRPAPMAQPAAAVPGTTVDFALDADLSDPARFWAMPYPSDLRLAAAGPWSRPGPDLRGFPNPRDNDYVRHAKEIAGDRPGFPVVPIGYFHFDAPLAKRDPTAVVPAEAAAPLLLVDVDPASPERGRLVPTVADVPLDDDFIPKNFLTVAARPGHVLAPNRTYAFVVKRALGDAARQPLGVPAALAQLAAGQTPAGGDRARAVYASLWDTLRTLGVEPAEVAAATVFTTGDVVADLAALARRVTERERERVTITDLAVDPSRAGQARYCTLAGRIALPVLQRGRPPFDDPAEGLFDADADGTPKTLGTTTAPIVLTLPRAPMPPAGHPLMLYFHGSGSESTELVDRGKVKVRGGEPTRGEGPAFVVAPFGIAGAATGLPVSPERLPPASSPCVNIYGYLNFCNLSAMRDTFRGGVIEQHLVLEALRTLAIPAADAAACGLPAPEGGAFRFDPDRTVAMGWSMGGMYANMVSATSPQIRALAPVGAGGFWTYFILHTTLVPGASPILAATIGASDEWTFMHPALHLVHTGWEWVDPMVYMPRLARRPLDGHSVRPIYEPIGQGDRFFPIALYDAIALAYGHPQAGDAIWPSLQMALETAGLAGVRAYPVSQDLTSATGAPYTGIAVQYAGDGLYDPHGVAFQLDAIKHQYGCFFSTFLARGVATVPAPSPGTPCP